MYGLLRNLVAPATVSERSYQELTATLKAHFNPKPIVIPERFHFHRRVQAMGESISEYVAKLIRLTNNCQFSQYLDEALRVRLVCEMGSQSTQKCLIAEADLTSSKALAVALSVEAAEKNMQQLNGCKSLAQTVSYQSAYMRSQVKGREPQEATSS